MADYACLPFSVAASLEGPLAVTEDRRCDQLVCNVEEGLYVINSTFCFSDDSGTTIAVKSSITTSTVIILMDVQDSRQAFKCKWTVDVPSLHKTLVTMDSRISTEDHLIIEVSNTGFCPDDRCTDLWNVPQLLAEDGFVVLYMRRAYFFLTSYIPRSRSSVAFHIKANPNLLLTGPHIGSSQYITLPMRNGLHPLEYDGYFMIDVAKGSVILIKISYFHTKDDYLAISTVVNNTREEVWKLAGEHHYIPLLCFQQSLFIQFSSNLFSPFGGFKLKYTKVPQYVRPKQVGTYTYNCSVPYFSSFKDIFRCDLIRDCDGYEDEDGCDIYSQACGGRAIEVGKKCISVLRQDISITWTEAQYFCLQNQQRLVQHVQRKDTWTILQKMKTEYNIYRFFVGLQMKKEMLLLHLSSLYKYVWQWTDSSSVFLVYGNIKSERLPYCGYLSRSNQMVHHTDCFKPTSMQVVCEFEKAKDDNSSLNQLDNPSLNTSLNHLWMFEILSCPNSHVTRNFLLCDVNSQCGVDEMMTTCPVENKHSNMFLCENGRQTLPYTLVCDHISHCIDSSDEDFCVFSKCNHTQFECSNHQCISLTDICNGEIECFDQTDELCTSPFKSQKTQVPFPVIVSIDKTGNVTFRTSYSCPSTHFRCVEQYCLPVYLRCNGVHDCMDREDEVACDSYTCQGYYRCRSSAVCLHPDHVCDDVVHCPGADDELLCHNITCPDVCQCRGLVFICSDNFNVSAYPQLRYLDVRSTHTWSRNLTSNVFLISVCLSDTGLTEMPVLSLFNLQHLDLSHNKIISFNTRYLRFLINLKTLSLSNNPLKRIFNMNMSGTDFSELKRKDILESSASSRLQRIDFSHTKINVFKSNTFRSFPKLSHLNMSWSRLHTISDEGFKASPNLQVLDVRGSPLNQFPYTLLRTLGSLKSVYSDNPVLCCEKTLPVNFDSKSCHTKADLLASCEDLLKTSSFRIFLWIFSSLSIVGNISSFVGRLVLRSQSGVQGTFHIFVVALTVADFSMGMYLAIIGIADLAYRGEYLWQATKWKNSEFCQMAGFLSLMSTEVSAFVICLITLDRFLVLCFPFSTLHFSRKSAVVACASVWIFGVLLAAIPLLPITSHWQFYQQTGICIPLPFTPSEDFEGHSYSLGVLIIINFVLFMLIAIGQAVIYWSVQKNSMSSSRHAGSRDTVIVLRLTTVVMSDFLCWFPVGLLGLLASAGTPIPPAVNVGVAIFVLPINSALNPFLYTINTLMEKRRKRREVHLMKSLQETFIADEINTSGLLAQGNKDAILSQIDGWMKRKLVTREEVVECFA